MLQQLCIYVNRLGFNVLYERKMLVQSTHGQANEFTCKGEKGRYRLREIWILNNVDVL